MGYVYDIVLIWSNSAYYVVKDRKNHCRHRIMELSYTIESVARIGGDVQ